MYGNLSLLTDLQVYVGYFAEVVQNTVTIKQAKRGSVYKHIYKLHILYLSIDKNKNKK